MDKLTRQDLYSLEDYDQRRSEFRVQVMAHKRNRVVRIGQHAGLYFEDRLTMHYQVQEMLRAERIFDSEGVAEELDAYNPLIPDGDNLKATLMIEYDDVEERKQALAKLLGIELKVWVAVDGYERTWAIADEDLERDTDEKTSSVHFLRFQFTPPMIAAAKEGAAVSIGIEHDQYSASVEPLPDKVRNALVADFD
ncbi:MAG: DUF3501 family protein [Gammaproteobacteria bacterium]|nr:DUF3501 family protein [Gammaproteobacteria bacterium]